MEGLIKQSSASVKKRSAWSVGRALVVSLAVAGLAMLPWGCGLGKEAVVVKGAPDAAAMATTMAPSVPALSAEAQGKLTPDSVVQWLKDGNARFVDGKSLNRDLMAQVKTTSKGQYPGAVVLSCIDSRIPTEMVFDMGVGDIFNARVAGNYVNVDILASMEFATKVAGSKVVVVMGHTSCGAVKGSCDNVDLGNITSLVKAIRPSVDAVTPEGDTCTSKNIKLVNDIVVHNVDATIKMIREKSPIMAEMESKGEIKIVGAMYDVSTGMVKFMNP